MTTFGFIGAGNMAGAIVRGAVAAGLTRRADKGGAGHR
ncbi:MAG: Pyrroline-5-carboxylate reductase, partial [Actinomyces urogenitalis DORA_12]